MNTPALLQCLNNYSGKLAMYLYCSSDNITFPIPGGRARYQMSTYKFLMRNCRSYTKRYKTIFTDNLKTPVKYLIKPDVNELLEFLANPPAMSVGYSEKGYSQINLSWPDLTNRNELTTSKILNWPDDPEEQSAIWAERTRIDEVNRTCRKNYLEYCVSIGHGQLKDPVGIYSISPEAFVVYRQFAKTLAPFLRLLS